MPETPLRRVNLHVPIIEEIGHQHNIGAPQDRKPVTDQTEPPNAQGMLLEAALDYARSGRPVFPLYPLNADGGCACGDPGCKSPGKHPIGPLVAHGLNEATTDRATIIQLWATWPDANIAVRTGAISGMVAMDVDAGRAGWDSASELESRFGPFPETPTVRTGGGGAHVWFLHPGGSVPNSSDRVGPGIDIRGDGGYIVAPPSVHHSGARYEWVEGLSLSDVPLTPLPPWLRRRLFPPSIPPRETFGKEQTARLHDGPLAEGGRNDRLMRLGAAFRRYGMTEQEIAAALLSVNAHRCRPPLDTAEVVRIAHSVARYAPAAMSPMRQFEYRHGQVVR